MNFFFVVMASLFVVGQGLNEITSSMTSRQFEKICRDKGREVKKNRASGQLVIECFRSNKEVQTAWFAKSGKFLGRLDRIRDRDGALVKDEEYNAQGELTQEMFYVQTNQSSEDHGVNMFVFDGQKNLVRGNIRLGKDTFVFASAELIFLNGEQISEKVFKSTFAKSFRVSEDASIYQLVTGVWNSQNNRPTPHKDHAPGGQP